MMYLIEWFEELSVPFEEILPTALPLPYMTLFPYKPVPMLIYPLEFDEIKLDEDL